LPQHPLLIVEDDALIAMYLEEVLNGSDYRVVGVAESAEDALRLADAHRPALALVDVSLKGPVQGDAVVRSLRDRHGVVSVLTTGHADGEVRSALSECGAAALIVKPYTREQLLAVLVQAAAGVGRPGRPA